MLVLSTKPRANTRNNITTVILTSFLENMKVKKIFFLIWCSQISVTVHSQLVSDQWVATFFKHSVCVFVWDCVWVCENVLVCGYVCVRERKNVRECVCVWLWESVCEGECVCVCVCVFVCVKGHKQVCGWNDQYEIFPVIHVSELRICVPLW
jgi:hypothetical protein